MAAPMKVACLVLVTAVILAILLGLVSKKETRVKLFRGLFLFAIQFVLGSSGFYVWTKIRSLFPNTQLSKSSRLLKWAVLTFVLTAHSYIAAYILLVGENPHWFSLLSHASLGFYIHFLLCFTFASFVNWLRGSTLISSRVILFISIFYAINVGLVGLYTASRLPEVRHIDISMKRLPQSMNGFKIIQVNDIHLGATVGRNRLDGIVDIVNSLDGDIVVIVGDLVDQTVDKLHLAAEPLRRLRSKYGTYFVTGNHEYYMGGVDDWFVKLRELGVTVLHNGHVKIPSEKNPADFLYLAGVDDLQGDAIQYDGHGMDIDKAMAGCDEDKAVVLLAHQPWSAKKALDSRHHIDLVLSGHTHGGQMFPLMIAAYLTNPFFLGLYEYNGSQVYVSEGTVFWGIPMRVGTSMEITHITLLH